MNVYLETNLWNALCDHPVDVDTLVGSLGARAINLDFSDHCVTEMAKTFRGYGTAADRGRQLFSCLSRFVDAGTRCTKQNMELIPAELTALTSKTEVEPFLSTKEHAQLKADIDKLASGIFDEAANRLIDERIEFARRTRQAQIRHLELRPEMKQKLMAISPDAFPTWLDEQFCPWTGKRFWQVKSCGSILTRRRAKHSVTRERFWPIRVFVSQEELSGRTFTTTGDAPIEAPTGPI
jgi:hypothetical protein